LSGKRDMTCLILKPVDTPGSAAKVAFDRTQVPHAAIFPVKGFDKSVLRR
jgi:hypothetical protein